MFSNKQQEWYYSSTMECPFESLSPALYLPSLAKSDESKNENITLHHHTMTLAHSNGTNSNSHNGPEHEQANQETVLEKKLSHNAGERERRRKLNAMYSSLRALLPPDPKRTLSTPKTVDSAVKYIRDKKQELQHLSRKKEELLKSISRRAVTLNHHQEQLINKALVESTIDSSTQQITTNWLTDTEIVVQVATSSWLSISDMLLRLEQNMLRVISVSSSVSSTTRTIYTFHLQMKEDGRVRSEQVNGMVLGFTPIIN